MGIWYLPMREVTLLDGKKIFKLMDQEGVPFEVICDILRSKDACFDLRSFAVAAYESGNYTISTLRKALLYVCKSEKEKELINSVFKD